MCDIFLPYLFTSSGKEGTVGTTKLTRKEILAEDPVHNAILHLIEFFRINGSKVAVFAAIIVILVFGVYSGSQYLDKKRAEAQEKFAKGLDFFHAEIKPDAANDPYGKSAVPAFRSEEAKYQAAIKEFSPVALGRFYGKLAIAARYYMGISQLQLGQMTVPDAEKIKKEAVQNLESVASNSSNRSLGFMAKKVLATYRYNSGNYKEAQALLDDMIKDPQCDLQKEDLSIQLSRIFDAQGKRDEAIRVLRDASSQSPSLGTNKSQIMAELDKLQKAPKTGPEVKSAHP
jgi:predicted negative regulator of RcsB-dependent stress response